MAWTLESQKTQGARTDSSYSMEVDGGILFRESVAFGDPQSQSQVSGASQRPAIQCYAEAEVYLEAATDAIVWALDSTLQEGDKVQELWIGTAPDATLLAYKSITYYLGGAPSQVSGASQSSPVKLVQMSITAAPATP